MPTKSLYMDLIIDTPEAAENFLKAFEIREKMGPIDTSGAPRIVTDPKEIRRILGVEEKDD